MPAKRRFILSAFRSCEGTIVCLMGFLPTALRNVRCMSRTTAVTCHLLRPPVSPRQPDLATAARKRAHHEVDASVFGIGVREMEDVGDNTLSLAEAKAMAPPSVLPVWLVSSVSTCP